MANDIQKKLQVALQKELKPLFIGLRNDLAALLSEQKKQTAKKPPTVQKIKVTNHPDIQKVEQINVPREVKITNPQKEVNVNGIKQLFGNLYNKLAQIHLEDTNTLTKLFAGLTKALKAQVFKVRVENQLALPTVLKVEEQNPTEQKQLQDVRITNSKPREAIPVVLVSHDLKRFYDVMVQLVGGGGHRRPNPRPGLRVGEFFRETGGSADLNVDGSTTPVEFTIAPPTGKKWFIHTVSLIMEDTAINFAKFGGRAALANGFDILVKEGGLPETSLGTFNQNSDFYIFTTNITFESATTDVFAFEVKVKELTGTTFELKASKSELLKVVVNDNLTTINRFNMLVRGYEIDE